MRYYYMLESEKEISKFKRFILKLFKFKITCKFKPNIE